MQLGERHALCCLASAVLACIVNDAGARLAGCLVCEHQNTSHTEWFLEQRHCCRLTWTSSRGSLTLKTQRKKMKLSSCTHYTRPVPLCAKHQERCFACMLHRHVLRHAATYVSWASLSRLAICRALMLVHTLVSRHCTLSALRGSICVTRSDQLAGIQQDVATPNRPVLNCM